MSWQELYQQKRMTMEQAVPHIESGDRVVVAHITGGPSALIDAMVKNANAYRNVKIVRMVVMSKGEYRLPEYTESLRHNSLFPGTFTRDAIMKGRGDFTPVYLSQIPDLPCEELHPNMVLLRLPPPDEYGYCSYGISVDYTRPAAEATGLRIARIGPNMSRTLGDSFIHVSELDCIIEMDDPTIELGQTKIGETGCAIGEHCAPLIQDGDCLQLGIGTIPGAALLFLKEKKDLGIHSEVFSDGVVGLVETGVITSRRETLHKGQCVVTFLMDSKRLHDYVSSNPPVVVYPVDYVNNPAVIAKNNSLVFINFCIQVDLMGQVVSDSIDPRQLSGVGGQVGFVRGANLSRGGKSIVAMLSSLAKKDGTHVSKIAVRIDADAAVTTPRYDVNYIITEFGAAELKGKTLRDRAKALTEIVRSDSREELMEEFHRRFGV